LCGLTGAISAVPGKVSRAAIIEATARIAHRGPDGEGIYGSEDGCVFLGHRRLAIIDVSQGSAQPYRTDHCVLVYNGEVYNFRELRRELERAGVLFSSTGDTEVLARGYEAWGTRVFERLQGMFAVAIHDLRQHGIVLARDRFGIKPLYFSSGPGVVSFASEIKSLVNVALGFAPDRLLDFFAWGYSLDHKSIFAGIRQVQPGAVIELRAEQGSVKITRIKGPAAPSRPASADADARDIARVLSTSVKAHMIADVPVALALSGGLDSSVVAALAGRLTPHLTAFTATFAEAGDAEVAYSRMVSRHCALDHRLVKIEISDLEMAMRSVAYHIEEPIAHPNHLITLALGAAVRKAGYKVILVGEGSDEIFAGYPWHRLGLQSAGLDPAACFSALRDRRGLGNTSYLRRSALAAMKERAGQWQDHFTRAVFAGGTPSLAAMLHYDRLFQLQFSQLQRVDRMTMASGVEARVPYLYDSVVAMADRLPDKLRVRTSRWRFGGRKEKIALADAAREYLPSPVLARPKFGKRGTVNAWSTPAFTQLDGVFKEALASSDYGEEREMLSDAVDWSVVAETRLGKKERYFMVLLLMAAKNAIEGFRHRPPIADGFIIRPAAERAEDASAPCPSDATL
jgi:asparagine synthase (glutamine-hydrolysing)